MKMPNERGAGNGAMTLCLGVARGLHQVSGSPPDNSR